MNYKHQEQLKSIRSAAVILPKKKEKKKRCIYRPVSAAIRYMSQQSTFKQSAY